MRALTTCLICVLTIAPARADSWEWDARALYEQSVTRDVVLNAKKELKLERGVLVEDDGPAAGYSYQPNVEKLVPGVRIKKRLLLGDPSAKSVTLLIGSRDKLSCTINDRAVELGEGRKCGNYWQAFAIPPSILKRGLNEIVLWGKGSIWIARDDERPPDSEPPHRSAKSINDGKTWGKVRPAGEYYIRLFLDQYRPEGVLRLSVIDMLNPKRKLISPPSKPLGSVRIQVNGTSGITVRARSGSTLTPDENHWSEWQSPSTKGNLPDPKGRFLQVEVTLSGDDRSRPPKLTGVTIRTNVSAEQENRIEVLRADNPRIVRSSIPFEYEPMNHPKLKRLREQHRLDEVVKGAKREFEIITRLAKWSARRWKKGHLGEGYPPWDALEILKPHTDGKPVGGFCQQFNIVFLQACESFGIVGRAVSLGPGNHLDRIRSGHEVVELWSNDHRKWVYVDGNHAMYIADQKTGTPLSLLELRDRQLAAFDKRPHPPVRIVNLIAGTEPLPSLTEKIPFMELRMIPRSNFLERKAPLPLNQGMRGWFWTGHHVWTDEKLPARLLYGNRVHKRANWEWTLNQAHLALEATEQPGMLRVHIDTVTPGLESFVADVDGGKQQRISSGWLWKLRAGENRLVVRPRSVAGREGIPSEVVLRYEPSPP